jgi:hypothetical protein
MPGLPSDLRQRLLPTYIFLVAHSATRFANAGALAPEWDLELATLLPPLTGPLVKALLHLDFLLR